MSSSVDRLTAIALLIALAFPAHMPTAGSSEANAPTPHASRHYSLPATPENVRARS